MSEPTAERVAAIRERAAFDALPWKEQLPILRARFIEDLGHEPDTWDADDWYEFLRHEHQGRVVSQCRDDRAFLLARLDEQAERVRALEDLLSTYTEGDADQRTYRAARRALGAGEGAT